MSMKKDEFVTIRIRSDVKEKLKEKADKEERTLSNMISLILKESVNVK